MILSGQLFYPFWHFVVGNFVTRLAYGFKCTSTAKIGHMGCPKACNQDISDLRSGAVCWAPLLSFSVVNVNTRWRLRMKSMTPLSLDSAKRILMPYSSPPKHVYFKSYFVSYGEKLSVSYCIPVTLNTCYRGCCRVRRAGRSPFAASLGQGVLNSFQCCFADCPELWIPRSPWQPFPGPKGMWHMWLMI